MTKSLIIDFVILSKLELSTKDLLYLVWIDNPDSVKSMHDILKKHNTTKLVEKAYIKINEKGEAQLRQSGIDLINYLRIDSFKEFNAPKVIKKSSKKIKAEVLERVNEYRALWANLKGGSMGDKQACITKLSRWMETNPEYSFEQILQAAQIYLDTEGRNLTYLQRADYFIYKQENNKEETSRLSAFIDEVGNSNSSREWTTVLI